MIQRSDGQTKMRGIDATLTFCRHNVLIGYIWIVQDPDDNKLEFFIEQILG